MSTLEKIVILTGAGVSAESGISTFRDAGGLWEGQDLQKVASPEGFERNPKLVLDFYNQRRKQLFDVDPNEAHRQIANLEGQYHTVVITQNVDDLHERAGSTNIIHLHGELRKVRCTENPSEIIDWDHDLHLGDLSSSGAQLRPHIVWFGEEVPMLQYAIREILTADIVMIVGTSMQVYPAAGLINYAPPNSKVIYVDPNPTINHELQHIDDRLTIIQQPATTGVPEAINYLHG